MSSVNWNEVFATNSTDVVGFANGTITLRNFQRAVKARDARREVNKLRDTKSGRNLARRACHRRAIALSN